LGFPDGHPDGVYASGVLRGRQATGWIQIEDVKETGYRVEPGFRGTPVWDERLKGVVGMAVAAGTRPEVRVACTIPADVLTSAWPIEEICYLQKLIAELEQRIGMYATLLLRHWGRSVIPSLC